MKSLNQFMCVMVALTVCVGPLAAEESQGDRVRFSVNARTDYTDNRDAWESTEDSNADFYLRPRVDVLFETESTLFDIYYAPALRYRTNPSENQNDLEVQQDLGLTVKYRPTRRLSLHLNEKFDLTDDPSVTEGGSTVRGDRSYVANTLRTGADYMVTRKSEIDVYVQNSIRRYDDDDMAARWDEDRTDVGSEFIRHLSKNVQISIEGRYSMYDYESVGGVVRDFDSALLAAGAEKTLSRRVTLGGQIGAQAQAYDDDEIDGSTNPFFRLYLRGNTTPALRLTGSLSHAVRDADAYPFAPQEYSEVRGIVDWDTTSHITLTFSGAYSMSRYEEVLPSAAELVELYGEPDGDETSINVYGQIAYKVNDYLTVLLRQRYQDVDSDVWVSYTKNTATLEVTTYF